nr:MAG TPA: hypothetical protein [Caudoviricetes sp.]DAM95521.1 MAG TPA: hypothetical protein [Caudoviricetes sp.]
MSVLAFFCLESQAPRRERAKTVSPIFGHGFPAKRATPLRFCGALTSACSPRRTTSKGVVARVHNPFGAVSF